MTKIQRENDLRRNWLKSVRNIEQLRTSKIKEYQNIQNRFFLISLFLSPIIFLLVVIFPISSFIYNLSKSIFNNYYLQLSAYIAILILLGKILFFPYDIYKNYYIEKRFGLSNETLLSYLKDQLIIVLLNLILGIILLNVFYLFINIVGSLWWLALSGFFIFFNIILAKLYPVLIMPIFNKFKPIEDEELLTIIKNLMNKCNVKVKDFLYMDMSRRTKKANAFFTGIGKSKRVVLGDTLFRDYTPEEIKIILAHEIGHYKKKHVIFGLILSSVVTLIAFLICSIVINRLFLLFNFSNISQITGLPLILFVLSVFYTIFSPILNFISRMFEKSADRFAIKITRNLEAFETVFLKLAEQNLIDINPSKWIKILKYSHPPVAERIEYAKIMFNSLKH